MAGLSSAAKDAVAIDGFWSATYHYTKVPPDHPFGGLAAVPLQALLVVRHGRLAGFDALGGEWLGTIAWSDVDHLQASFTIRPHPERQMWQVDGDGRIVTGEVSYHLLFEVLIAGDRLVASATREAGPYRIEGTMALKDRFDGADF